MVKGKRKQLTINLGELHDAWLEVARFYKVRPSTLAAEVIKLSIEQHRNELSSGKFPKALTGLVRNTAESRDIKLRLNPDEIAAIDRFAEATGKKRNSALIGIIRMFVANEPQYTVEEIAVLRESTTELNKIGVNLNQIAHQVNTADLDKVTDGKVVAELVRRLLKRTDALNISITKHVAKVWSLLNACRYRSDIIQGKTKESK